MRVLLFFFLFFNGIGFIATAQESQLNEIKGLSLNIEEDAGQQGQSVGFAGSVEPRWQALDGDNGFEFFWMAILNVPNNKIIKSASVKQGSVGFDKIKATDPIKKLYVKMLSPSEELSLQLENKQIISFKVHIVMNDFIFISRNCENSRFNFKAETFKSLGLKYAAVRCSGQGEQGKVSMYLSDSGSIASAPRGKVKGVYIFKDQELIQLLETRQFAIQSSTNQTPQPVQFEVKPAPVKKDQEMKLEAVQKDPNKNNDLKKNENNLVQAVIEDAIKTLSRYRFGLGFMNVNHGFDAGAHSTNNKPVALVDLEMHPFKNTKFAVGWTGLTGLPTLNSVHFVAHTELEAHANYLLYEQKNGWSIEPRLYLFLVDGVNQDFLMFYNRGLLVLGGKIIKKFKKNQISAEAFYDIGTLKTTFLWEDINPNKETSWGIFAVYSNQIVSVSDIGDNWTVKQISIGGLLNF